MDICMSKEQEDGEKQLGAGETMEETLPDDKVPAKLLGKRPTKPSFPNIEHELKKNKLEEMKDVAKVLEKPFKSPKKSKPVKPQDNAAPVEPEGKISKEKHQPEEEKPQEIGYKVPKSESASKVDPSTVKAGASPSTPEGRQPPRMVFETPARPKAASRLIKDKHIKRKNQMKQDVHKKKSKSEKKQ